MATEAQIERDWELVAALAADLHDAHARAPSVRQCAPTQQELVRVCRGEGPRSRLPPSRSP